MASLTIVQAVNQALKEEMRRDPDVLCLGEDIAKLGGVFRCTEGLLDEFGEERVINTPLAEGGIIGAAIGMALYGLKPVAEIQFLDFILPAFDQIVNEAAKMRYRSGGQYPVPMVIRAPYGGGIRGGHYHSQSIEALFAHTPGLKVVIPSGPYDAKGMLKTAIRDGDPVMFLEPKRIYRALKEEVPDTDYTVPFGQAKIAREGTDVSVICYGAMVPVCKDAAEKAQEKGVSVEVLDLRSLVPLDIEALMTTVAKTGRIIIVYEACRTCGFGAEISALIAERAIEHIEAPILRVAGFDTPFPYALEHVYMPDSKRVLAAIEHVANY